MVKFSPKQSEEVKVVGVVSPYIPTMAAFYDFKESKTVLKQVMYYVIRENLIKSADFISTIETNPVCFDRDFTKMIEITKSEKDSLGFLGLTSETDPKKESFSEEIKDLKKRVKNIIE